MKIKVSFGRIMRQALELLQFVKRLVSGQSNVEQCKNQAHSQWLATYACLKVNE